jgi:hypothetical protein
MQIIQAATVFSNNGEMLRPQIINRIIAADGTVTQNFRREIIRKVVNPQIATDMLVMLEHGVTDGIANRARVHGVSIGAKTGTSQIFDFNIGAYSDTDHIASAIAYIPAINPQYIIYIAITRPSATTFWGATVVSPLISQIVTDLIPRSGLGASQITSYRLPREIELVMPTTAQTNNLPNFANFNSLAQVMTFALQHNLSITMHGKQNNKIVSQFPPAGSLLINGSSVAIYFEGSNIPIVF